MNQGRGAAPGFCVAPTCDAYMSLTDFITQKRDHTMQRCSADKIHFLLVRKLTADTLTKLIAAEFEELSA
jgi:hypothetical protein